MKFTRVTVENYMYTSVNQEKEHTDGPYIIDGCIAVRINNYLEVAGITPEHPGYEEIFERLLDYSEWLEDRFGRGLDSIEAIADSFLEEYGDLYPDEMLESLESLKSDLLKVMEALELSISKARMKVGNTD